MEANNPMARVLSDLRDRLTNFAARNAVVKRASPRLAQGGDVMRTLKALRQGVHAAAGDLFHHGSCQCMRQPEAHLEAPGQDEKPFVIRVTTNHGLEPCRPGTQARPAFDYRGATQNGRDIDCARKQGIKLTIGKIGVVEPAFARAADRHLSVFVRNDIKPFGKDDRQGFVDIGAKQRCLALDGTAACRPPGLCQTIDEAEACDAGGEDQAIEGQSAPVREQKPAACRLDRDDFRTFLALNMRKLVQCGTQHRKKVAWRHPRGQRVLDDTEGRRIGGRPTAFIGVADLPKVLVCRPSPILCRIPLTAVGDLAQMCSPNGHDPTGAAVACREAGCGFKLGDLAFERHQGIELKLLLLVPTVRHMRHERAEETAARAGTDPPSLEKPRRKAGAPSHHSGPQAHDAAAHDQNFAHRLTFPDGRIIGFTMTGTDPGKSPSPSRQNLEWHEGDMPYSTEFGDHFYCRTDGRLECGHVFLAGNGLPERWGSGGAMTIGELGFGTGLNFCETWRQWKRVPAPRKCLHFVSFERFPMHAGEIDRALAHWPEIDEERQALVANWPTDPVARVDIDFTAEVRLTIVIGAAFGGVSTSPPNFDAWYLDGFAPSRNPDMWSKELMQLVFDRTVGGGSFATYAAAGFVRRNLAAAGFAVERRPGFAGKREMLRGVKPAI